MGIKGANGGSGSSSSSTVEIAGNNGQVRDLRGSIVYVDV